MEFNIPVLISIGAFCSATLTAIVGIVVTFVTVKNKLNNVAKDFDEHQDKITSLMFHPDGGTNFVRVSVCEKIHEKVTKVHDEQKDWRNNFSNELAGIKTEIKALSAAITEQTKTTSAIREATVNSVKTSEQISTQLAQVMVILGEKGNKTNS